jgi:hypothetical protein
MATGDMATMNRDPITRRASPIQQAGYKPTVVIPKSNKNQSINCFLFHSETRPMFINRIFNSVPLTNKKTQI